MSNRSRPGTSRAAGSTLRGIPRSRTSSARRARDPSGASAVTPSRCGEASTAVTSTSASPSTPGTSSKATAATSMPGGADRSRSSARSGVRLATSTRAGRRAPERPTSDWVTPVPTSPAPTTTTVLPARPPGRRPSASSTAAWENEVVPRAMPVSERTRFPARMAWRNNSASTGPLTRSPWARSQARRTWPSTSDSPGTADSRPEATANRWAGTSSSKRIWRWGSRVAAGTPALSASTSSTSWTASWKRSTTA